MKKVALLFVLFVLATSFSFAQNEEMGMNDQMKIWMEYMTPSKMHDMMAASVGEWKTTTKYWMDPSAPEPMVSEGTATVEMILGGRYMKTVHKGNVMGMPMEGWSIEAYDNGKKEFLNIWVDNMGTGMATSTGKYNEENRTISYTGKMYDPMSGSDVDFRSEVKIMDDNNFVFEMYNMINGKEVKMMEMTYTR